MISRERFDPHVGSPGARTNRWKAILRQFDLSFTQCLARSAVAARGLLSAQRLLPWQNVSCILTNAFCRGRTGAAFCPTPSAVEERVLHSSQRVVTELPCAASDPPPNGPLNPKARGPCGRDPSTEIFSTSQLGLIMRAGPPWWRPGRRIGSGPPSLVLLREITPNRLRHSRKLNTIHPTIASYRLATDQVPGDTEVESWG